MAKELPYFRFTPQEWQNGNISLERYELRGLFIDICCYYWIKNCSITLAMLDKRYSNDKKLLDELIDINLICIEKDTDYIVISFLNEQFDLLSEKRERRRNAGSKGGKQKSSNAKAMLKQKSSYKDKDKDNNICLKTLEERANEFGKSLEKFITSENKQEIIKFWNHWTQPEQNKKNPKLKFELQKTWDTKRRLNTWFANAEKWKK